MSCGRHSVHSQVPVQKPQAPPTHAPVGDPASHASAPCLMPLPQARVVEVVVDVLDVVVVEVVVDVLDVVVVEVVVDVLAVVVVEVLVDVLDVVVVEVVVEVLDVVVVGVGCETTSRPGSDRAAGPGRLAAPSIPLRVSAVQNTEASVTLAGVPRRRIPAAAPLSEMLRQAALPKQPGTTCPLQKVPSVFAVAPAAAVVREARLVIAPRCTPSMHSPPPGVHGLVASTPPGGQ